MTKYLKALSRKILPNIVFDFLKRIQRIIVFNGPGPYSLDEHVSLRYVNKSLDAEEFFVDIGAQDGVLGSQTLFLAKRNWSGIAIEADKKMFVELNYFYKNFKNVSLLNKFVNPENICELLSINKTPINFGFLNLDIDSFDFYILDALLEKYTPKIICVEINELIPPPIRFTIIENDWEGVGDNFQGFSIEMISDICRKHGYKILELHFNNIFLSKDSEFEYQESSISDIYKTGYLNQPLRRKYFEWNNKYEHIYSLSEKEQLSFFQDLFKERDGKYLLEVQKEP